MGLIIRTRSVTRGSSEIHLSIVAKQQRQTTDNPVAKISMPPWDSGQNRKLSAYQDNAHFKIFESISVAQQKVNLMLLTGGV